ncbi:hypothetical protein QQF64_002633 [Cirrhinus molitorella]|uniref:Uncharacterized protein n=1 Tax=Cirrhinus molitorella TaxID=172907 RepID=A0ABR3MQP0_9TELE
MVEKYGRIPPVSICVSYALGIITLFPSLKDKFSPTSYVRWASDVAAILLLLHLFPLTRKGRKTGKISATEAADHVVKFMKVGTSIKHFLSELDPYNPSSCVLEKR